jgi:predicted DNA-binding transcriptional regulator YafY
VPAGIAIPPSSQSRLATRTTVLIGGSHRNASSSVTELADLFGVARSTVYRAQQRHQAAARP